MCTDNQEIINKIKEKPYRMKFHLMPPMGWMNDPNGSCFFNHAYHVFFQYSPQEVEGGLKCWGHYRSGNLVNWEYMGIAIRPDTPEEKDGAYSGCGFTQDGTLELFYTGNVKKQGDYDYITEGREANIIYTESKDGIHFSEKEVVLQNIDYPQGYTCHVRDPLVWKEDDRYYMILGARKGSKDQSSHQGTILLYSSRDKKHWEYIREISTRNPFGYMWECPDYFVLQNQPVIAACPQGVEEEEYRFLNSDQSGYFMMQDTIWKQEFLEESNFYEWDLGFDFYAPQSFLAPDGRRLLIGWVGLPQPEYTNEHTVKEGWQHCLSLPRELSLRDGQIYQQPARELEMLRGKKCMVEDGYVKINSGSFDAVFVFQSQYSHKKIMIGEDLVFEYTNGIATLHFLNESGEGRRERRTVMNGLQNLRIIQDVSIVEIFANDGKYVFTTRYYPENVNATSLITEARLSTADVWEINML